MVLFGQRYDELPMHCRKSTRQDEQSSPRADFGVSSLWALNERNGRRHARSQQSHLGFEVQRNDAPATACLVRINSNSMRLR
jgi:hypothetical protein